MLIVKLVDPKRHGHVMAYEAGSEVHFQPVGKVSAAQLGDLVTRWEASGHEVRCIVEWGEGATAHAAQVVLGAGKRGDRPVVIFTNHHAFLCNDEGRTIDRIHRHVD